MFQWATWKALAAMAVAAILAFIGALGRAKRAGARQALEKMKAADLARADEIRAAAQEAERHSNDAVGNLTDDDLDDRLRELRRHH